jgi:hypothetical protein
MLRFALSAVALAAVLATAQPVFADSRRNGVRSCPSRGRRKGAAQFAGACMVVVTGCAGDERRARQEPRSGWVWLGLDKRRSLTGDPSDRTRALTVVASWFG